MPETNPSPAQISPTAIAVADAARILTSLSGVAITEQMIRDDFADGAPANADGTLNLVHYAAWLVKEMASGN